jgi:hypothetical protein
MRVPQIPNSGFNGVNGGMTVYYMQDGLYNFQQTSKVQAFQPVSAPSSSIPRLRPSAFH